MINKELYSEIIKGDFIQEIKKYFLNHKISSVVSLIILIIVIISPLWTVLDGLVTTGTLMAVIINIYVNAKNNEMQLKKIPIYFNDRKLNLDIARKDFSRSELQGILGILRKNMKVPYEIESLSQLNYIDTIYKIQKSELHELKIYITENELEQFKNDIY